MKHPAAPDTESRDPNEPTGRMRGLAENRAPLLALAVLVLVFLVGLGASRSLAHVGGPGDLAKARSLTGSLIIVLIAVAVVPATIYVAWELLRQFLGEEQLPSDKAPSTVKRLLTQLAVLAGVAAVAFALAMSGRENGSAPLPASSTPERTPAVTKTATERDIQALLPWVVAGVMIALVVLVVAALVLRRQRRSQELTGELDELELQRRDLQGVIEDSLALDLREPDPRKAVIRAYTGMERMLAGHGLGRKRFEAPFEYLTRALAAVRLSGPAAERLTRLFERARFSEHAIGPEMKSEAIAALSEVRNELEPEPR